MATALDNDITGSDYWDSWWLSHESDADPIRPHWPEIGSRGFYLRTVERHTGSLVGKSVCELGGAMSGNLLAMAKWRGARVTAIDYSAPAIEATRRMFAKNDCTVKAICSDFFASELRHLHFDLITHTGVLEHQRDPVPLIELSAGMADTVMFSMPNMQGPGAWLWRKRDPANWGRHVFHSDDSIYRAFERIRFTCKRIFWGPPFIHMPGLREDSSFEKLCAKAHFWMLQIDRFKFSPYHFGMPYISYSRGFVASKRSS
jgi:hypothetical protein